MTAFRHWNEARTRKKNLFTQLKYSHVFFYRFGLVNVKYGVAMIIKNFKITPSARMEYPVKLDTKAPNMQPKDGFWLDFEKISHENHF